MRYFIKYFFIALSIQSVFCALAFALPQIFGAIWGGFAYLFYLLPVIILLPPKRGQDTEVSLFILFALPMIIYSVLIALGIYFIKKVKNTRRTKLS